VVDTPLSLDASTHNRVFGHHIRILVGIDLSRCVFDEIMVEREGYALNVEVFYEWFPDLCSQCKVIGHCVSNYRRLHPLKEDNKDDRKKIMETKHLLATLKSYNL